MARFYQKTDIKILKFLKYFSQKISTNKLTVSVYELYDLTDEEIAIIENMT
jgi:hypothetical protein